MRLLLPLRSLLAQSIVWIAVPLVLVMFTVIAMAVYAYQQVVTTLTIDRDRQLATFSATRISESFEGYARVLEALASNSDVRSPSPEMRAMTLEGASEALEIFNAGVMIVDMQGRVMTAAPAGGAPVGESVAAMDYFVAVRERLAPAFSQVVTDVRNSQDMIVVAAPLFDETNQFAGALLGALHLHNTPLGEPVRRLIVGDEGFAYLVDGHGRVIFHPDASFVGADFTSRPFVRRVMAGESGGALSTTLNGERIVLGYAPVQSAGWGLVVREPWESVVAPAQFYGAAVAIVGLGALLVTAFLLWQGVQRITTPVRLLAAQTSRLAIGEAVEPVAESGILEIDALERSFARMAEQMASYRAGLRRYVGAITRAQEDEQRRLARELHDETTQSLLAIGRRLELIQASEGDPARLARLAELQSMVTDTLKGVRQISQHLRPLALEDLGLIPALRTLIRAAGNGDGAGPEIKLKVSGQAPSLDPEQELALYRITQEALSNIRRHARAAHVEIELSFGGSMMKLAVWDDGTGFRAPSSFAEFAQQGHFGLMGMQERVWAVGGMLALDSAPGHGTRLSVTMPVDSHARRIAGRPEPS